MDAAEEKWSGSVMSAQKWGRKNLGKPCPNRDWHKSFSVTIEVDVAKILGIVGFLALAVLCVFGPSGQHFSGASTIDELWRFLTPDTVERH